MKKFMIFLILAVSFICSYARADVKVTASSIQEEGILPEYAFDSNFQTRWSSEFSDPQWLEIDLGEVKEISGLILNWEAAYGSHYEILLSSDENNWVSVYETTAGDGKTDDIYFKTTPARFIKILGKKRGTSWGYSLWEVTVKGEEEEPVIESLSYQENNLPSNIMDGNLETVWVTAQSAPQWIEVDLGKEKTLGGLQLNWGENYAVNYEVLISPDKESWQSVYETIKSNGGKDLIYFDKTRARYIKLICKESKGEGFSLRELALKGPDEHSTPEKFYEVLAEDSPPGYLPRWVYKLQAYWTVVGVEEDKDETLFADDGTIEPHKDSFSLMPYLFIDEDLITSSDCEISLSLEEGYLPIPAVEWNYQGLIFNQKIFACGTKGKSATYVWYVLENTTSDTVKGKLYLALRPVQLNPPWQYGGLTKIKSIGFESSKETSVVKVNNKDALVLLSQPDGFGAVAFKEGDIISFLAENHLPQRVSIEDSQGFASGAVEFAFELEPSGKKEFFFLFPLSPEADIKRLKSRTAKREFEKALKRVIKYWKSQLDKIYIDIPQEELIEVLKVNLAYLLINRDNFALYPGPRNYDRSWIRDGSVMSAALLRTGHSKEAREYIDWVSECQLPSGEIPCMLEADGNMPQWGEDWKEYDGQGAYVFAISDYYKFTKDKKFLKEKFPSVVMALKFLEDIRKMRLTYKYKNTCFYGILPESNSHEGYFPAQHSLWDDFWALCGWKEGQYIASILGRDDLINWMKTEETELRKNLLNNIELIQKQKNIKHIPGCFEKGDFDATSTAISVWPTAEANYLPRESLMYTLNEYYKNTFSPRLKVGLRSAYTPYEIRTATAYLMLGEKDKALKMFNYFLRDMRPREWKHWAEVVHDVYDRPQYIGDMPHTWIGAIAINFIRNLFVYEKGDTLILAAGIDWDRIKKDKPVIAKDLPTQFGKINYYIKQKDSRADVKIWGRAKPDEFKFRLPSLDKIKQVELNGKKLESSAGEISFSKLPASIKIYFNKTKTVSKDD